MSSKILLIYYARFKKFLSLNKEGNIIFLDHEEDNSNLIPLDTQELNATDIVPLTYERFFFICNVDRGNNYY